MAALASCQGSQLEPATDSSKRGPGPTADQMPGSPGFDLPDAAPPAPGGPATTVEPCAEETHAGQVPPLDLLLLVDTSASMNEPIGARTKWLLASDALATFVRDRKSAGLGVGLQYFPHVPPSHLCTTDADCGLTGPSPNFWCHASHVCIAPKMPLGLARPCDPAAPVLCRGFPCRPLGRCAESGLDCLDIGGPCPTGAGDTCTARPSTCQNVNDTGSCSAADYRKLVVGIAELPKAAAALTGALAAKLPAGGTPLGAAAEGALTHLRAHLTARPGRRAALVLVSDGLPQGCPPNDDVEQVAGALEAARTTSPAIPTYVIGVFDQTALNNPGVALDRLAAAGGTGAPFLVTTAANLTPRFLEALDQIRGSARACTFDIPAPSQGPVDYSRVNVRVTGPGGPQDLAYVSTPDRCHPSRGGWHYDQDPGASTPTRILLCPASCNRLEQAPGQTVELRFGCRSRRIE